MKSNICKLPSGTKDINLFKNILTETQKVAIYAALEKKDSGRLRLLSEELIGMLPELLAFSEGEFWIEYEKRAFELHTVLKPNESLTYDRREKLLEVSSSGKNAAAVGIMAKIKRAVEFMLVDYEQNATMVDTFYAHGVTDISAFPVQGWSLNTYRENASAEKGESWDELEKSIIANIADDVLVGLTDKRVEIIVKKSF